MAVISGVRDTYTVLSNKRVIDMADKITMLQPDESPLTILTKKLNKKSCFSPKFEWLEDDLQARWDAVNNGAGYTDANTDIVVDNGTYFAVNDLVKVPRTGEVLLVTVVATNTLTVTRAYGETAAAALLDNDTLVIIGTAMQEGSTTPTIKSASETAAYNYTQIFRKAFGVTGTENASKMYGGNDLAYQRKKKGIEHMVDIERAFLFGERKEDNTGSHPRRATRGVLKYISTNSTNVNGAITKNDLDTFCKSIFQYGSSRKVLLCSGTLLAAISTIAGTTLQTVPSDQSFGIDIKEYITPFGRLNLIYHKLLESTYDGYGIALDLPNVSYRFLEGRDTKLMTNTQTNDTDGQTDEYMTECGLQLQLEKTHGVIYGVTGA